jgi:hypothetical protein
MLIQASIAAKIASEVTALGDQLLPDITGKRLHALPLYADLGGAVLLRADGQFLELQWDKPSEQDPIERDEPSWKVALVAGAERYPWLAELLPSRPDNAVNCEVCDGTGRFPHAGSSRGYLFCGRCDGLGWYERAV